MLGSGVDLRGTTLLAGPRSTSTSSVSRAFIPKMKSASRQRGVSLPSIETMRSPGLESGRGARRVGLDDADDGRLELVRRHARADGEDRGVEDEREGQVHQRPREQDERPLPALADGRRLARGPLRRPWTRPGPRPMTRT